MSLRDIDDWSAWSQDSANLYCGRKHETLGDHGFGNNYRVARHGRDIAIALFKQFQLPLFSEEQLATLRSKRQLACWCSMNENCHVEEIIKYL